MDNNANAKRKIPVFIASPGDLGEERQYFRQAIDELNRGFSDGANVEFEALGWEDTLASTGRRNQGVINQEIDRCEVFVLVMHRRWGQPAPDSAFDSYTEEEFHRALERFKKDKKPEIFVFFKRVDPGQEADAGPQLEKVLAFKRQLEDTRQVLYRTFDDAQAFKTEIDQHLRAYVKGDLSPPDAEDEVVMLPMDALEEVKKAKAEAEKHAQAAKETQNQLEEAHLEMAEDAAKFALEGAPEHARQKFIKLLADSSDLSVLFLAYEFFYRTGDLQAAKTAMEKSLDNSGKEEGASHAAAYGNLGLVYQTQGDLDKAIEYYQKSLVIEEALGRKEGMASDYGNLGNVYQIRGDLDKAVEYYQQALAINEALGRKEGMANQYGNLGNVYQTQGDLDKAIEYYQKSLVIEEALGRKEGMASDYGNLGIMYETRGDLDKAHEYWEKSLALFRQIGAKLQIEQVQSWLDSLKEPEL